MLSQNNNSTVISSRGDIFLLKKLIVSAKNGDIQAFEELYTYLYTPLYRYTISKCHEKELAEDVCQQTFLNFYEALPSYEPEKSPLAYLFTIAKRLLINHGIKKTFTPFDDTLLDVYNDTSITIIEDAHTKLLAEKINEFLPSLSETEQEVIRFFFYAELSYKEISDILYKEESYIRKIKERALKKLRILTHHLYEEH
jgi:RNA polymerase sigma-70 factor (ECF subfamily)